MNRWGSGPWSNKVAAYWLAEMLNHDAAQRVTDALRLDAVEYRHEIRAAAGLLFLLHSANCWPAETVAQTLALDVSRLEEIQHKGLFRTDPEAREAFRRMADGG